MKFTSLVIATFILTFSSSWSKEGAETNVPPNPFGDVGEIEEIPDYAMEVDRTRGTFTLDAKDGEYQPGSHFGNWYWKLNVDRSGTYDVGLLYSSSRPKLGVQVKIGESNTLKSYAARTNELGEKKPLILGSAYLEKKGEYPVMLLTGDQSNADPFEVKGIHFTPAPESDAIGQSIDGTINLEAKSATTYAENMRYEPKEEKNCLGFWNDENDWAEWIFEVTAPGKFNVTVHYGCGNGNEGSEVAVLVNDQILKFTVEDTGGFQNWKAVDLGTVDLGIAGENKVAIVPQTKKAKGIMDIQQVVLTPAE